MGLYKFITLQIIPNIKISRSRMEIIADNFITLPSLFSLTFIARKIRLESYPAVRCKMAILIHLRMHV